MENELFTSELENIVIRNLIAIVKPSPILQATLILASSKYFSRSKLAFAAAFNAFKRASKCELQSYIHLENRQLQFQWIHSNSIFINGIRNRDILSEEGMGITIEILMISSGVSVTNINNNNDELNEDMAREKRFLRNKRSWITNLKTITRVLLLTPTASDVELRDNF